MKYNKIKILHIQHSEIRLYRFKGLFLVHLVLFKVKLVWSLASGMLIVVGQRGERRGVQVTHNLVQAGDLLLQQVILLLCDFLPLLGDLQSFQQLGVLHVQIFDQHVGLAVLVQLEKSEEVDDEGFDTVIRLAII